MIGNIIVVLMAVVNFWIRIDDPAAAIVPVGLCISFAVTGLLGFTGWRGGDLVYHHGVGVKPSD